MTPIQKLLAVIGIAQLQVDYIESIMDDPNFSGAFIQTLKRDAKNYIRSSEKMIDALSRTDNSDTHEQIADLYIVIAEAIEALDWDELIKPKEPTNE